VTPDKITLHKQDATLELVYPDASRALFTAEFLRVHSPSAEVRGHGPGEEILQYGKKNVGISGLKPTGHYALLIEFDDGHDTGIFSWTYLRELHERQDELWRDYLDRLAAAGKSRDPEEQVLKIFNPGQTH